jgi:hypothetical protein
MTVNVEKTGNEIYQFPSGMETKKAGETRLFFGVIPQ